MTVSGEIIKDIAYKYQKEMILLRRKIHEYPELGFQEYKTAELVIKTLENLGLPIQKDVARTGVVSLLDCGSEHTLAIRADMDALPIHEKTGLEFASKNIGVMHACGHDAHVAIVLGTAMILSELKDKLRVNIKFIFQPCEETPPGGAIEMIRDGVLNNPSVEAIFALHVSPQTMQGQVAVSKGTQMASTDLFNLTINGVAGHGACPGDAVDSIVVAAEVIQALQTIVSRKTNPDNPVVVSIGVINGGQKANIVADMVKMSGTIRTMNPTLRIKMPEMIQKIVNGITSAHGASFNIEVIEGRPVLSNNGSLVPLVRKAAGNIIGYNNLVLQTPTMVGEDFAYFLQEIPGVYFNLGCGIEGKNFPCHNPGFDVPEDILHVGAAIFSELVFSYQNEKIEESLNRHLKV